MSFFQAYRDGSISGSSVVRVHPFFVAGAITAVDTKGIQSLYSRVNSLVVFPLATTLERYSGRNLAVPTNDINLEFYQGGVTTGDTLVLTNADFDAETDLSPIAATVPANAGEIDGKAIELEVSHPSFSESNPQSATRYVVPGNNLLSWVAGGWVLALGSNAEEFVGINRTSAITTESTTQAPWARSGTLTTLMVLAIFQNGNNDKTYTFALRNGGADVISVSTTNSAAGGANVQLLTEVATTPSVAAGDFLNWRVSMSGGFTAGRAVQFMAILGFEDDN